jgi:UDP-galactopyranose mutase
MKKYDYLIVGCGCFGATFARIATDKGKKCLIIDKRSHIAGTVILRSNMGLISTNTGLIFFILQIKKYGIL